MQMSCTIRVPSMKIRVDELTKFIGAEGVVKIGQLDVHVNVVKVLQHVSPDILAQGELENLICALKSKDCTPGISLRRGTSNSAKYSSTSKDPSVENTWLATDSPDSVIESGLCCPSSVRVSNPTAT